VEQAEWMENELADPESRRSRAGVGSAMQGSAKELSQSHTFEITTGAVHPELAHSFPITQGIWMW